MNFKNIYKIFLKKFYVSIFLKEIFVKYKSCCWIEEGVNFDRRSYKVCCLYSAKGGGNTIIEDNYNGHKINWADVFDFKKKMKDLHKSGKIYPKCEGCIYLEDKDWADDHSKFSMINLDYWTKCNSRCRYCFTMTNKWKHNLFRNYHFLPILKDMIENNLLKPENGVVSFGGGEVTLLKEFDEVLDLIIQQGFPKIIIHSSAIKYSKSIEKGLENGSVQLIVSVDAGTKPLHKKIKQVNSYDKVWNNLLEYAKHQKFPNQVKTKYIVVPEINDNLEEISLWLEKSKDYGINSVIQEIESQWFYERREKPDLKIIELFEQTKNLADALKLEYSLYERAEHMMKFWKNQ